MQDMPMEKFRLKQGFLVRHKVLLQSKPIAVHENRTIPCIQCLLRYPASPASSSMAIGKTFRNLNMIHPLPAAALQGLNE